MLKKAILALTIVGALTGQASACDGREGTICSPESS